MSGRRGGLTLKEQQLFIPERIKVGYQKRTDTYTGKLAYVIYFDKKGVLRKEASWNSWRDKKITPDEFPNEPTEGFVLNKKAGGTSWGWNTRKTYSRVYDPRGFEFEISIPNLLFILQEGDCSRGKGLEGKFVYAWDKTELVLLPTHSEEYKRSISFTNLQDKAVKAKEMILGATYLNKKQEQLTYLGRLDYFFQVDVEYSYHASPKKDKEGVLKKYVFWNGSKFLYFNDLKSIATLHSGTCHPEYASLVDKYNKSDHGSRVVKLFLKEVPSKKREYWQREDTWFFEEPEGVFVECSTSYVNYQKPDLGVDKIHSNCRYHLPKGVFICEYKSCEAHAPGRKPARNPQYPSYYYPGRSTQEEMIYHSPTNHRLFAETEAGSTFRVEYPNFHKDK